MYSIQVDRAVELQLADLHPKRFKQIVLRLYALQQNPRPPDSMILDAETCRVSMGSYRVLYQIDDSIQRVSVIAIREQETGD